MTFPGYSRRDFLGLAALGTLGFALPRTASDPSAKGVAPVPFTRVSIHDRFWAPRIETNRTVTIPYDFQKCEETGRIDNFARAGRMADGPFQGIRYDDSDVYKVIEGASYSLQLHPDPALDAYLDRLIAKIAAAQEPDGYLYTARTLSERTGQQVPDIGPTRWSFLHHSHELYNAGHLYEAAAAHFQATGKRTLLDVALRNADLVAATFGPSGKHDIPGHPEIEIGLVRLYLLTNQRRYLDLAHFFLDQRGRHEGRPSYGNYVQDHLPVAGQHTATGHAVRAGYLYAGMADAGALLPEPAYIAAVDQLWQDVVSRKLYLSGGMGARREGEAFGDDYELPNRTAYSETCAAIANALWNHRMFLLHADARYLDVLERTVYNGFLAGVSLEGNRFFYPNPLESDGRFPFNHGAPERQPWFGTSCCPVNVVRFLPSLSGYFYGVRERDVYVGLYASGEASLDVAGTAVKIAQETDYPWQGNIRLTLTPSRPAAFTLRLRVPGWALGRPVPSDLYQYVDAAPADVRLAVNGEAAPLSLEQGFATLTRTWRPGDVVTLNLPMPVRRVVAHPNVIANRGRVALERGPLVYCIEGADHGGRALNLALPDTAALTPAHRPDLLGGITTLHGTALAVDRSAPDSDVPAAREVPLTAIPYYAWNHRGVGEMAIWLPRDPSGVALPPRPTLASRSTATASHVSAGDTLAALNDQQEPARSNDHDIPRLTWWDHRGTAEWVQYDLPEPSTISAVEVYWFDDAPGGGCRLPAAWRISYREGGVWKPVQAAGTSGCAPDRYNRVSFVPVRADAIRLDVTLQLGYSAGILEWKLG